MSETASTVHGAEAESTSNPPPPPEVSVTLLENKDLPKPKDLVRWHDDQVPIDILLLTVKDCEFLSCLSFLNVSFYKTCHDNLGFVYFGEIGEAGEDNLRIAVMKCHMGSTTPGGSTIVVKDAVAVLQPKAVFCVGFCGGLNLKKVKLGDVVISAKLITYAFCKSTESGIEERGVRVPLKKRLAKLILGAAEGWEAPLKNPGQLEVTVHREGVFLSGPEVVDNKERHAELCKRFPEATAIEMEGEGKSLTISQGGGGGGLLNKFLYGKAPPRAPNLYPFRYTIFDRKGTLSYTFHKKLYLFHIPMEQLFLNISLKKPLKILG